MEQLSLEHIGFSSGEQRFSYSWRDAVLYALAVGVKADDLAFLYEKELRILPGFGVIPYWGTFGFTPPRALPQPVPMLLGLDAMRSLHMAHRLVLHRPLPAYGGEFIMRDTLTDIFDHRGKGMVLRSELTACDENGQPVFTNIGDVLFRGYQSPGAPPYQRAEVYMPQRAADLILREHIGTEQHLLYRLCGDTNVGHVDDELIRSYGRRGAIMQGMCSFGVACRMAIQALLPGAEHRVCEMGVEMRNVVYPGAEIELQLWRTADNAASFRVINISDDNLALERGYLRWKQCDKL